MANHPKLLPILVTLVTQKEGYLKLAAESHSEGEAK
jgi:hypothetical protein